jgi:pimeloyl-ACP methyl ester carboxylesterase
MRAKIAVASAVACLAALSAATSAPAAPIAWHGCGDDMPSSLQCAELPVPLDYHDPGGPQISLGFARLPAADPAHRVGSLIINPGGPGGPGSSMLAPDAAGRPVWHPELHRRFDLIGMDPRGIGTSSPILCDPDTLNAPVSLFPRSAAEFAQLADYARGLGRGCLEGTGPLLRHVDTKSVARDMEALRVALGDEKLNFLGLSYGAEIGTLYAEMYPESIRTMALDGILDHSVSTSHLFDDLARAYEDSFNRFARWCEHTAACAFHSRDVGARFDDLVARADRDPIAAASCATDPCRSPVTGGDIRLRAFTALTTTKPLPALGLPGWAGLAEALAQAERGDASAFAAQLATDPRSDPLPGLAVNCLDFPREVSSYADYKAMAARGRRIAPHTQGAGEAWIGILGCLRWPAPNANPPHRAHIQGAPSMLLVSATHDPSTPYVAARRAARQIPSAVLLTRDGDGHTSSWLGASSDTASAIADYLVTGKRPHRGTHLPD